MNNENTKIFPKPRYDKLEEENNYSCTSDCTCKYLTDRTEFDKKFFNHFEKDKDLNVPLFNRSLNMSNENTRGWIG